MPYAVMYKIVILVFFLHSVTSYAEVTETYAATDINKLFNEVYRPLITSIIDVADKEEKVTVCMQEYIKKQSRSYAKIAQQTLYGLISDFENMTSYIYGKKKPPESIAYEEKITFLAKVQCDAYYKMGVLK